MDQVKEQKYEKGSNLKLAFKFLRISFGYKIVEMADEGLLTEVSTDILLTENKELGLNGVLFVVGAFSRFIEFQENIVTFCKEQRINIPTLYTLCQVLQRYGDWAWCVIFQPFCEYAKEHGEHDQSVLGKHHKDEGGDQRFGVVDSEEGTALLIVSSVGGLRGDQELLQPRFVAVC